MENKTSENTFKLINELQREKLDKKTFWIVIVVLAGIVGNLYILYYTGIGDIKSDIAVIKNEIEHINTKIN